MIDIGSYILAGIFNGIGFLIAMEIFDRFLKPKDKKAIIDNSNRKV